MSGAHTCGQNNPSLEHINAAPLMNPASAMRRVARAPSLAQAIANHCDDRRAGVGCSTKPPSEALPGPLPSHGISPPLLLANDQRRRRAFPLEAPDVVDPGRPLRGSRCMPPRPSKGLSMVILLALFATLLATRPVTALFDPGTEVRKDTVPLANQIENDQDRMDTGHAPQSPRSTSPGGASAPAQSRLPLQPPNDLVPYRFGEPVSLPPGCRRTDELFSQVCSNPWDFASLSNWWAGGRGRGNAGSGATSNGGAAKAGVRSQLVVCPLPSAPAAGDESGQPTAQLRTPRREKVYVVSGTITLPDDFNLSMLGDSSLDADDASTGGAQAKVELAVASGVGSAGWGSASSTSQGLATGPWPKEGDEGYWRQRENGRLVWVPATSVSPLLEPGVEGGADGGATGPETASSGTSDRSRSAADAADPASKQQADAYDAWSQSVGGVGSETWLSFEEWRRRVLEDERRTEMDRKAAAMKRKRAAGGGQGSTSAGESVQGRNEAGHASSEEQRSSGSTTTTEPSNADQQSQRDGRDAGGRETSTDATGAEASAALGVGGANDTLRSEVLPEQAPSGDLDANLVSGETSRGDGVAKPQEPGSLPALRDTKAHLDALKHRWNFASLDCAAVVHRTNPSARFASSILSESKDRYMLSPCPGAAKADKDATKARGGSADVPGVEKQFVIVELCDEIMIDTIVLANYEFFSRMFKRFRVRVSRTLQMEREEDWHDVGTFRARNVRGPQIFHTLTPKSDARFFRYVRVDFLEHYGSEYYCPVSLLRVYGLTQMDDYMREEEEMKRQLEQQRQSEMEEALIDAPSPGEASDGGAEAQAIGADSNDTDAVSMMASHLNSSNAAKEAEALAASAWEGLGLGSFPPPGVALNHSQGDEEIFDEETLAASDSAGAVDPASPSPSGAETISTASATAGVPSAHDEALRVETTSLTSSASQGHAAPGSRTSAEGTVSASVMSSHKISSSRAGDGIPLVTEGDRSRVAQPTVTSGDRLRASAASVTTPAEIDGSGSYPAVKATASQASEIGSQANSTASGSAGPKPQPDAGSYAPSATTTENSPSSAASAAKKASGSQSKEEVPARPAEKKEMSINAGEQDAQAANAIIPTSTSQNGQSSHSDAKQQPIVATASTATPSTSPSTQESIATNATASVVHSSSNLKKPASADASASQPHSATASSSVAQAQEAPRATSGSMGGGSSSGSSGSESIYRTITKRLNALEANATLSMRYIEHSGQMLKEVFTRMERRQEERLGEMLRALNSSNWRQIEGLKRRQQVDLQQAIFEFDTHRQRTDAERSRLLTEMHILANEVMLEKRFGIAQLLMLFGLFVFMILTRGSRAVPLINSGLAKMSTSRSRSASNADRSSVTKHGRHGEDSAVHTSGDDTGEGHAKPAKSSLRGRARFHATGRARLSSSNARHPERGSSSAARAAAAMAMAATSLKRHGTNPKSARKAVADHRRDSLGATLQIPSEADFARMSQQELRAWLGFLSPIATGDRRVSQQSSSASSNRRSSSRAEVGEAGHQQAPSLSQNAGRAGERVAVTSPNPGHSDLHMSNGSQQSSNTAKKRTTNDAVPSTSTKHHLPATAPPAIQSHPASHHRRTPSSAVGDESTSEWGTEVSDLDESSSAAEEAPFQDADPGDVSNVRRMSRREERRSEAPGAHASEQTYDHLALERSDTITISDSFSHFAADADTIKTQPVPLTDARPWASSLFSQEPSPLRQGVSPHRLARRASPIPRISTPSGSLSGSLSRPRTPSTGTGSPLRLRAPAMIKHRSLGVDSDADDDDDEDEVKLSGLAGPTLEPRHANRPGEDGDASHEMDWMKRANGVATTTPWNESAAARPKRSGSWQRRRADGAALGDATAAAPPRPATDISPVSGPPSDLHVDALANGVNGSGAVETFADAVRSPAGVSWMRNHVPAPLPLRTSNSSGAGAASPDDPLATLAGQRSGADTPRLYGAQGEAREGDLRA